ncbi:unnamed protein product, partial [Rotaria magnacalcarata]
MADFQTNQQKKDLVRSEFVKSCNNVNGTISFEQTKSILKTIGFDISSIKIEKLVIDQDVDGKDLLIKLLVYLELMNEK